MKRVENKKIFELSNRLVSFESNYEDRTYDRENKKIEKKFFILDRELKLQSIKEQDKEEYIVESESNFSNHNMQKLIESDWLHVHASYKTITVGEVLYKCQFESKIPKSYLWIDQCHIEDENKLR